MYYSSIISNFLKFFHDTFENVWKIHGSLNRRPHFLSNDKNCQAQKGTIVSSDILWNIADMFWQWCLRCIYCIWLVGDSCFNSRAHMCCGQPVRPLLFVGSSWPRFEADCKHDSFCEKTKILDDMCLHQKLILFL